jgi:hypothetical protein
MVLNAHRRRDLKRAKACQVFLNGANVTADCFYADVRRGVVRQYERTREGGRLIQDGHRAAWRELRGRVEFRPKVAA